MKQHTTITDEFLEKLLNNSSVLPANGQHTSLQQEILTEKRSTDSMIQDFLLAEFNNLQQRATQLEQLKSSSVNFFLLIVAAVATGVPTITSVISDLSHKKIVLTTTPLLLFIFGILTLNNSIDYAIAAIAHLRRAGRIRLWFVKQDPTISEFVPWEPADNRPKIYIPRLSFRGSEVSVSLINTISAALPVYVLLSDISILVSIIGFSVTIISIWFLQKYFIEKKLREAERLDLQNVHFPLKDK